MFKLGGPDGPEAVEPFLKNLFRDPAIISLPWFARLPLARLIARRRAPIAREIYNHIGGGSPIVAETRAQADAMVTNDRNKAPIRAKKRFMVGLLWTKLARSPEAGA